MRLVKDERVVLLELRMRDRLPQQHAVGRKGDVRRLGAFALEAHGVADGVAN